MTRLFSAAAVLLVLLSGNALAEQSAGYNATQTNRGGMIVPPSNDRDASNTTSDKSEQLGTPYYHAGS